MGTTAFSELEKNYCVVSYSENRTVSYSQKQARLAYLNKQLNKAMYEYTFCKLEGNNSIGTKSSFAWNYDKYIKCKFTEDNVTDHTLHIPLNIVILKFSQMLLSL